MHINLLVNKYCARYTCMHIGKYLYTWNLRVNKHRWWPQAGGRRENNGLFNGRKGRVLLGWVLLRSLWGGWPRVDSTRNCLPACVRLTWSAAAFAERGRLWLWLGVETSPAPRVLVSPCYLSIAGIWPCGLQTVVCLFEGTKVTDTKRWLRWEHRQKPEGFAAQCDSLTCPLLPFPGSGPGIWYCRLKRVFTIQATRVTSVRLKVQELCESRGGRPGLPVPNKPDGLCGRKETLVK